MSIQKWSLPIALVLAIAGCGGGGGNGQPTTPPTPTPVDNTVNITGRAVLSNEQSLSGAEIKIGEIDVTQTTTEVERRVQGKIVEITEKVFTTTPTVGTNGSIDIKLDPTLIDDPKLYRISVNCPTPATEICPLTKPLGAIMSGARLKLGNWNINVLTEIAYQRLAYYVAAAYNETELQSELEATAKTLLASDINHSGMLDSEDILQWEPSFTTSDEAIRRPGIVARVTSMLTDITINANTFQLALQALSGRIAGSMATQESAEEIVVSGNYAYVANGTQIDIVDVSSPTTPISAGRLDFASSIRDIAITEHYAYATNSQGLHIIDIHTPNAPTQVGTIATPGTADGVVVQGDYAFVVDGNLQIIDIKTPTLPRMVATIDTSGNANDVAVSGSNAYVADDHEGLLTIDISTPTNPEIASKISIDARYTDKIYIADGYAYLSVVTNPYRAMTSLKIIDIRSPTSPIEVASLQLPDYVGDLLVSNDHVYVADRRSGLQVVDISDPTAPTWAGSVDTPGEAKSVAISDGYAFIADSNSGLQVIDIATPPNQIVIGYIDLTDNLTDLVIAGSHAIGTFYWDGYSNLRIFDIENTNNPTQVGNSFGIGDFGMPALGITAIDNIAYVVSSALHIVDISVPDSPVLLGSEDAPDYAYGVTINGNYAYVADDHAGLRIIDVSSHAAPEVVGQIDTPGNANSVAIYGSYAYVADGNSGVQIIEVNDASAPTLVRNVDTPGYANSVEIQSGYVFVSDGLNGLQVIDIRSPLEPELVGNVNVGDYVTDAAVSGNYVYLASGHVGLQVIDIRVPTSPTLVGSARTLDVAQHVSAAKDFIYVGTSRGLEIHRAIPAQ